MPNTPRGRPPHADVLTPAEWRVLHAVQHGLANAEIARRMGISVNAIKYHLRNIRDKTGLTQRSALRQHFQLPMDTTRKEHHAMTTNKAFGTIGQVARTVSDIEASRNWYELVLELPHLYTFGKLSFFDCNGTRLMLAQEGEMNPKESTLYFRVDDISDTHRRLVDKGVEFIAAPHRIHTHADGTEEWMGFFKDPEGRPLALMAQMKGA
ncbi:MAG: LuxR C-terminal-related transcriptional regulator [Pseudomonadota bacterium]|nr:LuxR C-terminal-related transcriptional regulator [Pseudomonadota bacterium]